MEGGGGEGQWNRRGLCSQRIGSRLGSFNFIPFLRQTVPFHFSRLLSGKTSPVYEHLFFSFSLRNTVWAQVRSIKVREFLFKSNRKHCKRISIDAFEMMIIYDFFLEKYFLRKKSVFLMKYDYRYSLSNPYPRMKHSSVDGTK